jgi:DnaD/phage-associated family protein
LTIAFFGINCYTHFADKIEKGCLSMSPLRIYQDDCHDATIVSNLFIDEYMKDANDAQIKVFLYLLRMISAHKATSIADMADKFNYTEKDILRALKYWDKNKLLHVEYDEDKYPVGIHIRSAGKILPPEALPLIKPVLNNTNNITPLPKPAEPERVVNIFEKPSYSLDELKAFKEAEETSQLLFVVEQYLGKTLSPSDIKSILFFTDTLSFSGDLIDYLIQYCVERGKKDFRYIEKVAISWAEEGITTSKQAAKAARKYDKIVYDVMKDLGKNNAPTKAEADYIMRWVREFGFSADIINEACNRTVMAVDNHRFVYCNKILSSWKDSNVRTKADIQQLDSAHTFKKASAPPVTKNSGGKLQFGQFIQNDYDFEELERKIISN